MANSEKKQPQKEIKTFFISKNDAEIYDKNNSEQPIIEMFSVIAENEDTIGYIIATSE